ncbi:hypothetical protein JCM31598_30360 [Desulfonatronum parangueonense]
MELEFFLLLEAEDERSEPLKPDPKGLNVCAELLGVDPAESLLSATGMAGMASAHEDPACRIF